MPNRSNYNNFTIGGQLDPTRECTYNEYLRDCFIYKEFNELNLAQ
jgi:hypothetical protein